MYFFAVIAPAQVGSPGNFEKYEFQPEAWKLPDMSSGAVNDHGDYTTSLGLASISAPSGIGFNFSICYSSDIHYDDVSGWLGLGWQANPGTISRSVRGDNRPLDFSNSVPLNNVLKNANPVDLPSNLKKGYWDKNADIYYFTLPNGESFDAVIDPETISSNLHEFIISGARGFKVSAKYYSLPSISDGSISVSVSQSSYYANKVLGNTEPDRDYSAFLIEGPDGTRYLFKKPTYELNVGPTGKETIYVSTWRISAIISAWYSGADVWNADENYYTDKKQKSNIIKFHYDHESVNLIPRSIVSGNNGAGTISLEVVNHIRYLASVTSSTDSLVFNYIPDTDTDKQSKLLCLTSAGSYDKEVVQLKTYTLIQVTGRKRIQSLETYKLTKTTQSLFRKISLSYLTFKNRSFLESVDFPEFWDPYYFEYIQPEDENDFDYNLIWNYYRQMGDENDRIKAFLSNRPEYDPYVYPYDINGYFKRRSGNPAAYSSSANPMVGQLKRINFPTGRTEEIYYNRHRIEDKWDIKNYNSFHRTKEFYIYNYTIIGNEFSPVQKRGIVDLTTYFNGNNYFFKSCPDSIVKADFHSWKREVTQYRYSIPLFPGTAREFSFNRLDLIREAIINPDNDNFYFRGVKGNDKGIWGTLPSSPSNGDYYKDTTTSIIKIRFYLTENNRWWELSYTDFKDKTRNFVDQQPAASANQFVVQKASRGMDVEDKVWFGEIIEIKNKSISTNRSTVVPNKQPMALLIYNVAGKDPVVTTYSSNYHLVNIANSLSRAAKTESMLVKQTEAKRDYYARKVSISPTISSPIASPDWDYTTRYQFFKQTAYQIIDDKQLKKSFAAYDQFGNQTIAAEYSGKNKSNYQLKVTFTRFVYEETALTAPEHFRYKPLQVISGIWEVDSLSFANADKTLAELKKLEENLRLASGPQSTGDSAYKEVYSSFRLISNKVNKYIQFENGIFGLSSTFESKNRKIYRFNAFPESIIPSPDKWQADFKISSYYSFGIPKSVDFTRFKEYYYFGSKWNPQNTNEDSIYYFRPTARKIAGSQLSLYEYLFTAKYDALGRISEAFAPNRNKYQFGYDGANRLIKIVRNGKTIRKMNFDMSGGALNGVLRLSTTDFVSNTDSVITNDFYDGFGLVQTQTGNQSQLAISEPVFNNNSENVGQVIPHYYTTGEPGFVNPFNKQILNLFTNGTSLNFEKYSSYGKYNISYDKPYKDARKTGLAFENGAKLPITDRYASSFGTVEEVNGPGEGKRKLSRSKSVLRGRINDAYLAEFSIDEDGRADFKIVEMDGKVVLEGKTVASKNNILFSSPRTIAGLLRTVEKVKTIQGLRDPALDPTPDLDNGPGGTSDSGGTIYYQPLDPKECVVTSFGNVVQSDGIQDTSAENLNCGVNNTFDLSVDHRPRMFRQAYATYFDGYPLEVGDLVFNNLQAGKTLNLQKYDTWNEEMDTVQRFSGPILSDTIKFTSAIPGMIYKIDYYSDLGWTHDSASYVAPVKFETFNLMNLQALSSTFYTYNDLDQLVKITHPDGTETRYEYDNDGNVIRKETPYQAAKLKNAIKPESDVNSNPDYEYLFDQYGQIRMSIDPNQSVAGKMSVFHYDSFGRLIETGEMNSSGRFFTSNAENPVFPFSGAPLNGTAALDLSDRGGFTFPADYIWKQQFFYDGSDTSEGRIWQVRENVPKPDGSMGTFIKEVKYRKEGWIAKVNTTYPNGVTQEEVVYTFDLTGKPTFSALLLNGVLYQRKWAEYSPFGQLTKVWLSKTTAKPSAPTLTYNFNRFGQLKNKTFGPIQTKTFMGYTEEGWLSSLDVYPSLADVPNNSTRLFGLKYNYYNPSFSSERNLYPQYAGNITQMLTCHKDISDDLLETFAYDNLNRLSISSADKISNTTTAILKNNMYGSAYSYDLMGNILNLKRNWDSPSLPGNAELKDNFIYQYDGSQLRNLIDLSPVALDQSLNIKTQVSSVTGATQYQNVVYPGLSDGFEAYPAGTGLPSPEFKSTTVAQVSITTDPVKGKVLNLKQLATQPNPNIQMDTVQVVGSRTYQLQLNYKTDFIFDGEINQAARFSVSLVWLDGNKANLSTSVQLNNVSSATWLNVTKSVTAPATASFVIVKFSAYNIVWPANVWIDNVVFEENNLAYVYDANGNVLQDKVRAINGIKYNSINLPTQLTTVSQTVNYGYLWEGQRWFKKTGSTVQYYLRGSGGELLGEYTNTLSGMNYLNLYGADLEGKWQIDYPSEYFYVKDHLGNIRQTLKNLSGSPRIDSKTDYYPFGAVMRDPVHTLTPADSKFKYQNKERDLETGYDYFEARMYDSQLGRFLQVDPHAGRYLSSNPFVGMGNNPIRVIDPTGMDSVQRAQFLEVLKKYVEANPGGTYGYNPKKPTPSPEEVKNGAKTDCAGLMRSGQVAMGNEDPAEGQPGIKKKTEKGNWTNGVALIASGSQESSFKNLEEGNYVTFKTTRKDQQGELGEYDHIGAVQNIIRDKSGNLISFEVIHSFGNPDSPTSGPKIDKINMNQPSKYLIPKKVYKWDD